MNNELGDFLRQLRGKRSLRDIADLTGLSHTYIADIENGYRRGTNKPLKVSPEILKKLSKALNTSYAELMVLAGYWDKDDQENERLSEVYYEERKMENKIIALIKKIANDDNIFPSRYHEDIFKIFGGYASDNEIYERSSFRSRASFDNWYSGYLNQDAEDKTVDEELAIEEFNKYYNYRTIKQGIESLDRFINLSKTLDDFWNELVDFCLRHNIGYQDEQIRESSPPYLTGKELDEIPIEELALHNLTRKGKPLTDEQKQKLAQLIQSAADLLD